MNLSVKNKIILIASDLSGKPVAAGIAKTFGSGSKIKMKNLSEDIVTDYSNLDTELVLKSLYTKLSTVLDEYGSDVDYYLVCGGACLNIALVSMWAMANQIDLKYLVWEKKQGKYVGVDKKGRLLDFNDNSCGQFNYEEPEEITV
jgi:hypothetical protein